MTDLVNVSSTAGRVGTVRYGRLRHDDVEDIADVVACIVTRDRRVAVDEMLVRASE